MRRRKYSTLWGSVFFLLLLSASQEVAAQQERQQTVREFLNQYDEGDDNWKAGIETYVGALGKGIMWSNVVLKAQQRPPLYCFPDDKILTRQEYFDVMRSYAEDFPELLDRSAEYVSYALIEGLMQNYPCQF